MCRSIHTHTWQNCKTTPQWAVMNKKQAKPTARAPSLSPSLFSLDSLRRCRPTLICRRTARHPTFLWLLTAQLAAATTDGSQTGGLPWSASWGSSSWPLMMNRPSCCYPLLASASHELGVAPSKVALCLMTWIYSHKSNLSGNEEVQSS
jgi:hypothetical protein